MKPISAIALLLAVSTPLAAQVQPAPAPSSSAAETPPPPPPEARLSRDVGRAAGSLAVAAHQAAADAKAAAHQAKLEFKRGFVQGSAGAAAPRGPEGPPPPPPIRYEEEAVDACAAATEDEGMAYARLASVRDIESVDRRPDGWEVRGTVELRNGYAEPHHAPYRFVCAVRGGDVSDVWIRDVTARR